MSENVQQKIRLRHPLGEAEWNHGPIRIGRADDNQLVLRDESLSRHHAEIHPTRTGWVIRDLESANGIWLKGRRVPNARLRKGATVRLGNVDVVVVESKVAEARKWGVVVGMIGVALALAAGAHLFEHNSLEDSPKLERPSLAKYESRVPPPPPDLSSEEALSAAKKYANEPGGPGYALARARRALIWARALDTSGTKGAEIDALEYKVEAALQQRLHQGKLAFVRATKLGDTKGAHAALRMLREAFPYDDPRSYEIDRLDRSF